MRKLGLSLAICTVAILALASLAQAQYEGLVYIARMTEGEAK